MTQIPRIALIWILLAVAAGLTLHSQHLPLWIWGFIAAVMGWRWLVHQGQVSYPNKWSKALAVLVATVAVIASFGKQFSLESATAFLVVACVLKLLEMKSLRDGHIVIFLSYLLLAVGFLFQQGIIAGVFAVMAVWLITTALIALHQSVFAEQEQVTRASRLSAVLLLSAVPFMLVMYLVFPRFGPLWSVGLQSDQARTGLSDSMSPGDIAHLSQSDELAFRVSFQGDVPPPRSEWYWRALILDRYDGRRWEPVGKSAVEWAPDSWQPPNDAEGVLAYEIIQEPTDQQWLFALRGVAAIEPDTGMTADDRLLYRRPVHQRLRYKVKSWPSVLLDEQGLSRTEIWQYTQLPRQANPQTRAWANHQRAQYNSDEAYIGALLSYFRQQEFYYTLQPPTLGDHDIDDFLFATRRGFCAHYSSALTFMARAVGIPARIVAGYQGGEWNDEEKYLSVRQYDAHAWVEVWYAGKGWRRIDPTAAVSPARIELGLEAAMQEEGSFLQEQIFSTHKLKSIGWVNRLRLQLDSLDYYWQRWVLSYDGGRQQQLFNNWLGVQAYEKLLYSLGYLFAAVFLAGALLVWWGQRPKARSAFIKAWHQLQQKTASVGINSEAGETPTQYLQRLAQAYPAQQPAINQLQQQLVDYFYKRKGAPDKALEKQLAQTVSQLRRQLKTRH